MDIKQYLIEFGASLVSSEWQWNYVLLNMAVIFVALSLFKYKLAWITGVPFNDELAKKDNPAFGYVVGGAFFSFFLVMAGVSSGEGASDLVTELKLMIAFALSGMVMLLISRFVLDKISMRDFCLTEQIKEQNKAAGIVDACNMIATAIIIFTYMSWVKGDSFENIKYVAYGWLVSQILLSGLSFIRAKIFKAEDGSTLQDNIKSGNIAVAFRYSCYKIAFAMTMFTASYHYEYSEEYTWWYAQSIILAGIVLSAGIKLATFIAKKIILFSINFRNEINDQNNTGLAVVEGLLVIGMTILIFKNLQ
jgi:uncharacterized membrane protein YjfL (UPF0719 family)